MRYFRFAAAAGALAAVVAAAVPATATPVATDDGPSGPVVASSTALGPIRQNPRVDARDNGQSVLYHGRSVWFFDDTILQDPFGFLSSTAAVTSDLDASDGIELTSSDPFDPASAGEPLVTVPYSAAETRFQDEHASDDCAESADDYCGAVFAFWPGAAVADPARGRILISYLKLCRGGQEGTPCASGFIGQGIGSGIAEVDMRSRRVTRLVPEHQSEHLPSPEGSDNSLFFPFDTDWGGPSFVRRGDTLYSYGKCTDDGCALAKAPLSKIQDLSRWRYYTGSRHGRPQWSRDPDHVVTVINRGSAGGTVNFDPQFGGYLHTYLPALSRDVQYQTAPRPWGPWSAPATLFTAPQTDGVEYAAYAHPEYDSNHGLTKYYSYYTSSTGDQMLVRVDFTRDRQTSGEGSPTR